MIGYQPTLPVPPLSTVYGLISAAVGRLVIPKDTPLGYYFTSDGYGTDLERILEIEPGKIEKINRLKREFLANVHLTLYIDPSFEADFQTPRYPLLLGRSSDLTTVDELKLVEIEERMEGQMMPGVYTILPKACRRAVICALPVYFDDNIPRKAIGSRKFFLTEEEFYSSERAWFDKEENKGFQLYTAQTLGV